MDFKDSIEFFSDIRVQESPPFGKEEIKASLDKLQSIFPDWANPDEQPDLLFLASNLVVCDMMNGNHVCLPVEEAKKIRKGFINKLVDIEHNRQRIIGFIINAVFTKVENDEVIDEADLDKYDGLVQISYAAAIWKLASKKLSDFLIRASNPDSTEYNKVSSSFELMANDWDIAVGDKYVKQAKIFTPDSPEYEQYAAYLPNKKGSGRLKTGEYVYRVLRGDILAAGAGLVANPASQVEGIYTLIGETEVVEKEEKAKILEKNNNILKITDNNGVNSNTTKPMKIVKVEDITASLFKDEAVASSVTSFIATEIAKASETFSKQIEEQKGFVAKVEAEKVAAEARSNELQAKITELAAQLNKIEEEKAAVQADKDYQDRMAAFDSEYDLDDDDRKSLSSDIKACKSKEEFSAFAAKIKPLLKEKSKVFKKEKASKLKEAVIASASSVKGLSFDKVEVNEKTLDLTEIVASLKEVKQTELPNTVPPSTEKTLLERMNAFKGNIKYNGTAIK